MAGMQHNSATLPVFTAASTITFGQLVELTSTKDNVQPAGSASTKAIGYATHDAATGENVTVQTLNGGGIAKASAGGSIAIGDYLVAGASGVVTKLTLGASNQYVVGQALSAAASGDLFDVNPVFSIAQGA